MGSTARPGAPPIEDEDADAASFAVPRAVRYRAGTMASWGQRFAARWREEGARAALRDAGLAAALEASALLLAPFRRSAHGQDYYHIVEDFTARVNAQTSPRVLELGSRNVTGVRHRSHLASHVDLVGLDVHPGQDVDVVGDAHDLSPRFEAESFDAVFAISVFEHLAMPWKVVLEVNRVLKPDGLLLVATHPAWPPHELPWDFWRFSPAGLRVLLHPQTGFEVLRCGEGEPGRMFALTNTPPVRGLHRNRTSLAVAALARKCGPPADGLRWDTRLEEILDTSYRSA